MTVSVIALTAIVTKFDILKTAYSRGTLEMVIRYLLTLIERLTDHYASYIMSNLMTLN